MKKQKVQKLRENVIWKSLWLTKEGYLKSLLIKLDYLLIKSLKLVMKMFGGLNFFPIFVVNFNSFFVFSRKSLGMKAREIFSEKLRR